MFLKKPTIRHLNGKPFQTLHLACEMVCCFPHKIVNHFKNLVQGFTFTLYVKNSVLPQTHKTIINHFKPFQPFQTISNTVFCWLLLFREKPLQKCRALFCRGLRGFLVNHFKKMILCKVS
jgi:hypothetical protein